MWRQEPLAEQVNPALVVVVGVVHLAVVFAPVGLVIVVAVETVEVFVGLDVEHQEGLVVVGDAIQVAVGIRDAVMVLVLIQKHAVYVGADIGGVITQQSTVINVGKVIPIVVIVHRLPVHVIVERSREMA